jgi:triphosphatase
MSITRRKALKELPYQGEFFSELYSERSAKKFIRRLKKLQDIFGDIIDARTASRIFDIQLHERPTADAARAAGYTVAHHECDAVHVWKQTGPAWRKLRRSELFWN